MWLIGFRHRYEKKIRNRIPGHWLNWVKVKKGYRISQVDQFDYYVVGCMWRQWRMTWLQWIISKPELFLKVFDLAIKLIKLIFRFIDRVSNSQWNCTRQKSLEKFILIQQFTVIVPDIVLDCKQDKIEWKSD